MNTTPSQWTAAACCRCIKPAQLARSLKDGLHLLDRRTLGTLFRLQPSMPFTPAGWLSKAAAGCRSPQRFAVLLTVIVCAVSIHADEQTVRIIGLSDPSRVNDLREAIKTLPELELVSVDADKATATLRYDPVALLGKPKPKPEELAPEKIIERIDNRIGTASIRTFSATAPTGVSEDKLTKVEIKVGVLDCKGCRYGAYIAIAKMDGVERAIVKADSRTLIAWIDSSKTNKEALEAALKKARVELPAL